MKEKICFCRTLSPIKDINLQKKTNTLLSFVISVWSHPFVLLIRMRM